MKRAGEGAPYLSFALIVRNASATLDACLKSLRERAPDAEIVVVDTCSSDVDETGVPKTHQIAQRYADVWEEWKGPNGDWSREMYAFSDAAAARNRSFSLCNGKWICWVDADDIIAGPEEAERLLKLNNRWKPGNAARVADRERPAEPTTLTDFLRFVDEKLPRVQGFRCPYLYQANPDGSAVTWQERERIVRNNAKWHWQRPAHEILVPKDVRDYEQLHSLSHLLFVHKKQFTAEDREFSVRRHFNILIKEYNAGVRHLQALLYLENFSIFLCPERRPEFIKAAYEAASSNIDRARALIRAGNFAAEQGFFFDAVEHFAGATTIAPDFPDGWISGAAVFERAENPLKAAEWMVRGVHCPTDCNVSDINPRAQAIEMRVRAAMLLYKGSRRLVAAGRSNDAVTVLDQAVTLCNEALVHPAIGDDVSEARCWLGLFANELNALRMAVCIETLHGYLAANDETQKALTLLGAVPHNLEDHPTIIKLQEWAKPMVKHLGDKEAYRKFYDEIGTDIVSEERGLDYQSALARVRFVIDWIRANKPNARVLEVGSFDGITALPLLRELPEVHYTAVETKKDALQRLEERAEKYGVAHRLTTVHGLLLDPQKTEGSFDVVIFYEVIEHVPDPVIAIGRLLAFLKPEGRLFLSTPWGAFDRGAPTPMPPQRDPRGHVRAMTPKEFVDTTEEAGGRVVELTGDHTSHNYGDTMYLCAQRALGTRDYRQRTGAAAFYVAGALWDWNATHVEKTGIGASEETIVYLARHMAQLGRDVEVYGPVPTATAIPEEEVRNGVKYWTREKMRHLHPDKTLVVSRAPSLGAVVPHDNKILWLQDAYYPDINEQVLKAYRKVTVLTEWHKKVMHENHGIPLEMMELTPNFLLAEHFEGNVLRQPAKFIYASSPDRGLINLLKLWPDVLKAFPSAELHIFYGWEGCMRLGASADPTWVERYRKIRTQYLTLKHQAGIHERGRVNHLTLAREFKSATAWLYPTAFDETGCLTAAKALAAGCVPVCTPRAGLAETAASELTEFVNMPPGLDPACDGVNVEHHPEWDAYKHDFVAGIYEAVKKTEDERSLASAQAIAKFRIESIWPKWRELLQRG